MILLKISKKLHEIEKIWGCGRGGGGTPLRSATASEYSVWGILPLVILYAITWEGQLIMHFLFSIEWVGVGSLGFCVNTHSIYLFCL